jgi:hypothetical protein
MSVKPFTMHWSNLFRFDANLANVIDNYMMRRVVLFCDWCKMEDTRRMKSYLLYDCFSKSFQAVLMSIVFKLSADQISNSIQYGSTKVCIQLCVQGVIVVQPMYKFLSIHWKMAQCFKQNRSYNCKSIDDIQDYDFFGTKMIIRKVIFLSLSYLFLQ